MINTSETIRETRKSPLDWHCANCVRDIASLNTRGRCPNCQSDAVHSSPLVKTERSPNA